MMTVTNVTGDEMKPKCKLIGENGNIFNLVAIASRVLRDNGKAKEADELNHRIWDCESYDQALSVIGEYVDIY